MKTFLKAEWKDLIMINFEVPKEILESYVPPGTELDLWEGKAYVSLVAFMFDKTTVMGFPAIGNRKFPEVNLRIYLKRVEKGELRRGVTFIKEIVPKPLVSFMANTFFHEHYETCKMTNSSRFEYGVKKDREHIFSAKELKDLAPLTTGSFEEFIAEHYWGFSKANDRKTVEYEVEHPKWKIYKGAVVEYNCDFEKLYGHEWALLNELRPTSCFVANGSEIKVSYPKFLKF